jgi:hypothetical protein
MQPRHWIAALTTVGVLVGLGEMPYGYYNLLRFAVCGFSLYLLFGENSLKSDWQRWLTAGCAILYNPIVPVRIGDKGIWIVLNILTVAWFWFLAVQGHRRT